MKHTSL